MAGQRLTRSGGNGDVCRVVRRVIAPIPRHAAVELLLDGYVPAAGVDVEAVLAGGFIVFDVIAPLVLSGAVPPAAKYATVSARKNAAGSRRTRPLFASSSSFTRPGLASGCAAATTGRTRSSNSARAACQSGAHSAMARDHASGSRHCDPT